MGESSQMSNEPVYCKDCAYDDFQGEVELCDVHAAVTTARGAGSEADEEVAQKIHDALCSQMHIGRTCECRPPMDSTALIENIAAALRAREQEVWDKVIKIANAVDTPRFPDGKLARTRGPNPNALVKRRIIAALASQRKG